MNRNSVMTPVLLLLTACSAIDPRGASLDFNELDGGMTEAQAMALQSRLEWRCGDDTQYRHQYGQRACDGFLNSLDSIPATRIDYLFRDGHLSAAIIEFPPDSLKQLKAQLDRNMGQGSDVNVPRTPANGAFGAGADLIFWKAKGGTVLSSRSGRNAAGNVVVIWMSSQELARFTGN
jgi:hypothetical protein